MGIAFDFAGTPENPEDIHNGGGERPKPGRGMAVITGWSEYTGASGKAHELELEIVAWTDQESVAKKHKENIFHTDTTGKGWPMRRMTCLAMAAGLFNANDVRRWKTEGSMPEIDMSQLEGRPIMIELVEVPDDRNAGKTFINIGNIGLGFWHCTDTKTKDWPKNQGILSRSSATIGQWIVSDQKAAAKQASKTSAASSSADPFAV